MSDVTLILYTYGLIVCGGGAVLLGTMMRAQREDREGKRRLEEKYVLMTLQTQDLIREGRRETRQLINENRQSQEAWFAYMDRRWERGFRLWRRDVREHRRALRKLDAEHRDTQLLIRMLKERLEKDPEERGGGAKA